MTNSAKIFHFPAASKAAEIQEQHRVVADVDNGYIRVANQIQDMLCVVDLTGRQFRVVNAVIRRTYGFQRKSAYLKAPFIAELIGYQGDVSHIRADIRHLKARNILIEADGELGSNPIISDWVLTKQAENGPVTGGKRTGGKRPVNERKTARKQAENGPQTSRNQPPSKETSKETNIKTKTNKGLDLSAVPEWLNIQSVQDFADHRKAIRKPLTQIALTRLITKLDSFRLQGIDPNACLDESIVNGWQGVFAPKGGTRTGQPVNRQQALEQRNAQAVDEFAGGYAEYEARGSVIEGGVS